MSEKNVTEEDKKMTITDTKGNVKEVMKMVTEVGQLSKETAPQAYLLTQLVSQI